MESVLISACLVGEAVRYNAAAVRPDRLWLGSIAGRYRLLPFCPEVAAGLPVPRPSAEIVGGDGHDVLHGRASVMDARGEDLTSVFMEAAALALRICRDNRITVAVLAENSPSCGRSSIYDGSFTGQRIAGAGVTSARLLESGITVFSQQQIVDLLAGENGECLQLCPRHSTVKASSLLPGEKVS